MTNTKREVTWADKTYGRVCEKCGKRHVMIATRGHNLPKTDSLKCEKKV